MLTAIIAIFVIGYIMIALEHTLHINKAATALLIGVLCWTLYALDFDRLLPAESVPEWFSNKLAADHAHADLPNREFLLHGQLAEFVSEIAQILFFLMGAMTIVELIDAHEGFSVITNLIKAKKKVTLLWIIAWITFFLSSVLDNLTTTIVMISLLRKLVHDTQTRRFFAGIVIVAANAGGAWSVIGDVTTTMLWVKNKIGTVETGTGLFLASVACLIVPLLFISRTMTGELEVASEREQEEGVDKNIQPWHRTLFFVLGCYTPSAIHGDSLCISRSLVRFRIGKSYDGRTNAYFDWRVSSPETDRYVEYPLFPRYLVSRWIACCDRYTPVACGLAKCHDWE
jgi:hypothetical protein